MSISGIVFVHSIIIIEMPSKSAVTTATSVVAVICGVAARTTFEVVSKSSFEILSIRKDWGCSGNLWCDGLPAVLHMLQ
jgi:hypothetical protein